MRCLGYIFGFVAVCFTVALLGTACSHFFVSVPCDPCVTNFDH